MKTSYYLCFTYIEYVEECNSPIIKRSIKVSNTKELKELKKNNYRTYKVQYFGEYLCQKGYRGKMYYKLWKELENEKSI